MNILIFFPFLKEQKSLFFRGDFFSSKLTMCIFIIGRMAIHRPSFIIVLFFEENGILLSVTWQFLFIKSFNSQITWNFVFLEDGSLIMIT